MALACVLSRTQLGFDAPLVHVEVHLDRGLPQFMIVGLPAPVVRESRERVRAALINSGFDFPPGRITVNLAPVELAKEGGRFDLPVAVGVLLAGRQLSASDAPPFECYGELGLGGELKPVPGLFLAALHAARARHRLYLPAGNVEEARYAGHADVHGLGHLRELAGALMKSDAPADRPCIERAEVDPHPDLADVAGQWQAKRALIIAAAGGHSLLMVGPPGSGKSMLAARLPGLLPPLSDEEALEVAGIAALSAARFDSRHWRRRPFRSPHHTASAQAIVGGGRQLRPGEISLAHCGVLFLDELPEFDRRVLESLREPLESGTITIARASGRLELPARFQLVAAMNPCPCGYLGDVRHECRCTPQQVQRYRSRLSGPLLDRIDMRIDVARVETQALMSAADAAVVRAAGEGATGQIRPRTRTVPAGGETASDAPWLRQIAAARDLQLHRAGCVNARLSVRQVGECCALEPAARRLLEQGRESLGLSARGLNRLLRLARTIADMACSKTVVTEHLSEAMQLRRALEAPAMPITSVPATPCSRRLP